MTEREALKLMIENAKAIFYRVSFDAHGCGGEEGGNGGLVHDDTVVVAHQLLKATIIAERVCNETQ